MEPSNEAIAVRITRLNRQILGKVTSGSTKFIKKTIDREALLDALTTLYDECNDDPVKKTDELVRVFVDKYRSTLADLRKTRVCFSDFQILQTIGRGYFGEVHMVREKQTHDVYALKTVRKELARKRVAGAEDERDVLATATTSWMPRLQYAFQDNTNLYLVMELCSGGDLAGLLSRRNHPLSEKDAAFYVCEVAHALKALHGMGYVHRDVKPHNILLDRCGHIKLGDFGSCARLSSDGTCTLPGATADYVAPELLAAVHCASTHTVCSAYCRGIVTQAISACDYWSLGVVAFELVTLRRPFSSDEEDSVAQILSNIQSYERDPNPQPPFPSPNCPSSDWRSLVAGLLRVQPARRYNYLDTLQHPALADVSVHTIKDQAPPWVPIVRGVEDTSYLPEPARMTPPPSAAPFRTRPPFNGQLPFVGYSYVAPDDAEDTFSSVGFNSSHDCTAIDLATFKSAEKLAAMRSREITTLQSKLAAAEAHASVAAERTRRDLEAEAERQRARLQADITALSLQNRRLERQVEVEKEERMALQRTNQELGTVASERGSSEARSARAEADRAVAEREAAKADLVRLESRVEELQAELARALTAADVQRAQHQHYKEILEQAQALRHRRLTEINVRAIDSVAKERAIRRQTLSGSDHELREASLKIAAAEASLARETRNREQMEKRLAALNDEYDKLQAQYKALQAEIDIASLQLTSAQTSINDKQRSIEVSSDQLGEIQTKLAQEKLRVSTLVAQVQELEKGIEESIRRETAIEEQGARTEARLNERLQAAESRAAAAMEEDVRHREKVTSLEQLVRQLEREVTNLESRACVHCSLNEAEESNKSKEDGNKSSDEANKSLEERKRDAQSDTESMGMGEAVGQVALLKEQLEKAEKLLSAKSEEIIALKQEARQSNLARWRKEREYNELSVEMKTTTQKSKRFEERLNTALEAKKAAELKANTLQSEMETLKPQHERASKDVVRLREELEKLQKTHEIVQNEVDRSRNDIRKLKCELQYSEKRRLHAEEQEEMSSRERAQMRDENQILRADNTQLAQNNKALQEACGMLEEQLTDFEKLADIHELKSKDFEDELNRLRSELSECRLRLELSQKQAIEFSAAANHANNQSEEARETASHAHCQLQLLREKLENRESRVAELESLAATLEGAQSSSAAALTSAARRVRDLQEECASLRTRAHEHHSNALQLQAKLADTQEELDAAREAAEAATAWWRTRETKTEATLRQQAKLIDFLQAKVEESARKKCSLSNKLFGRSGRRNNASPPLRRSNRELRDEVDRLRAKLAASNSSFYVNSFTPTPKKDRTKPTFNGVTSIDTPDGTVDDTLLVVWPDDTRERMHARCEDNKLVLKSGERELRARLLHTEAKNLPQNEANRAFVIKLETSPIKDPTAAIVCPNLSSRSTWLHKLEASPIASLEYSPGAISQHESEPAAALFVANNAIAIGCKDGLHSLRGSVRVEFNSDVSPVRHATDGVAAMCAVNGRALFVYSGVLVQGPLLALGSALRRAGSLFPSIEVGTVKLPDSTPPHLLKVTSVDVIDGPSVAVACGRRVFLLRFDAALSEFKISRSLTVDRPPYSLLLTPKCLYIAGEKPLKINLPSGALETFAIEEPIVAAAAKKHSPPKAILLIKQKPIEILLCYSECGVFVDEYGKRTRNDDPKWSSAIYSWEYVMPLLYLLGDEKITIIHVSDDAYKAPPCTCDNHSLASSTSECYAPEVYQLKIKEPILLGTAPNGIIIQSKDDDVYTVSIIKGMSAFKSIGASIDSLDTIATDPKGSTSSVDLCNSNTDLSASPPNVSQESIEATTGFLADIRTRARQLREKNRQDHSDAMIKQILTTEVDLNRKSSLGGRKSPATTSEFDSDSTVSDDKPSSKCTTDLCAEMFTRQVRFQQK